MFEVMVKKRQRQTDKLQLFSWMLDVPIITSDKLIKMIYLKQTLCYLLWVGVQKFP